MTIRYFIILFSLFISVTTLKAQTPLTEAVDFTVKDIHGTQYQLFDILDNQQKYVFIDFFSVTCGPCQTIAPMVETVYQNFGKNEAELFVMAIDQNFSNEMVLEFEEIYNTHYPAISGQEGNGGEVYEAYEIPYYPSLILIAPDHSIIEQAIPVPNTAQDLIELLESHGIEQTVGIEDIQNHTAIQWHFYPNPAQNHLNIQSTSSIKEILIYQLTGQKILERRLDKSSQNESLNISHLQKGIYLLSVEFTSGERISKTFVKQ